MQESTTQKRAASPPHQSIEQSQKRQKQEKIKSRWQIRIDGLSKNINEEKFVELLKNAGIEALLVKKKRAWTYAFLHVASQECQEDIAKKLANGQLGNFKIKIKLIDDEVEEKPVIDIDPKEALMSKVTPLWKMPYDEQLALKTRKAQEVLKSFTNQVADSPVPELLPTIPSPVLYNYRTKCEFTIGTDLEGKRRVGFLLGGFRQHKRLIVQDPSECVHVSKEALEIAKSFQNYIENHAWEPLDGVSKQGVWRLLVVKTFSTGESMLVVQIHPQNLTTEEKDAEKERLKATFSDKVTTLLWQEFDGVFNGFSEKEPLQVLTGTGYVHETLLGIKFRVSPLAFFQINQPATEKLYIVIKDWSLEGKRGILLDLCCGTGTIGLTMCNDADKVIGVELSSSAIEDANYNAKANNVTNVEYICKRVEDAMQQVFNQVPVDAHVVAVLDPPREGVHPKVIKAIRQCSSLKHIVFVACNPKASLRNFVELCVPSGGKHVGEPFKITRVQTVDLFPQTEHMEMVLEFRR